ncbi:MAG TPA: hypothetical protein VMR31_07720 [Myxococcota bacterium]|nr:hypothetical protein [Myxococcota bacterium]
MKRFASHLSRIAGFALAGLIGASFATGTAQSVVASLVQIVNTSANPVLTQDNDNRARQPLSFRASISVLPGAENGFARPAYTVPAGKRLVIEHVSAIGNVASPEQVFTITVYADSGSVYTYLPVTNLSAQEDAPTRHDVVASQPLTMYVDPGDSVDIEISSDGGANGVLSMSVSVTGYLVNLP